MLEVGDNYQTCMGFSAMPSGHDATEITASVGNPDRPSSTVILRILRQAGGATRKAASGDTGLLAQGSAVPEAAQGPGTRYRPHVTPVDQSKRNLGITGPTPDTVSAGNCIVVPSGWRTP